MNTKTYNWLLYLIASTIVITIVVQVYWNYKNYLQNKQRVTNEIQLSLDNALEEYYAGLAKTDYLTIIETRHDTNPEDSTRKKTTLPNFSFMETKDLNVFYNNSSSLKNKADSLFIKVQNDLKEKTKGRYDSISGFTKFSENGDGYTIKRPNSFKKVKVLKGKQAYDSLSVMKSLKPILIAINRDTLEYSKIDSLIDNQLNQKSIKISYVINHSQADTLLHGTKINDGNNKLLITHSKSTYLKPKEAFKLLYKNPFSEALKRSSVGILISFLLSAAVISSLFYLLKIIKHQKQIAEMKNDLISNITHEFKTPIATISVALESIKNFNALDDKEKTKSYLDMSENQLVKLNIMVEKLLETATLDSDNLNLQKGEINIVNLINSQVEKHGLNTYKTIAFNSDIDSILLNVDAFHFDNAISNIIDNAIKYGGDTITIKIKVLSKAVQINISDNGNSLSKTNKDRIFEKFYRIPKGNTHDIKGFGIGLYYTKKVIEKHDGTINLNLSNGLTTFNISLPNE